MITNQIRSMSHRRRLFGGAYQDKVLGYVPLVYYPMNELTGSVAVNLGSLGSAANGTYTGVTLNDTAGPGGQGAPLFDGANDYLNILNAAITAAWDAGGDQWSILAWFKAYNAGVWTDGLNRTILTQYEDADNYLSIYKNSANNTLTTVLWKAGGVSEIHSETPFDATTWKCLLVARDEASDEVIPYIDGSPLTTLTTIGTWASAAPWSKLLVGANATTPTLVWYGWLQHLAMFNRTLSAGDAVDLATI